MYRGPPPVTLPGWDGFCAACYRVRYRNREMEERQVAYVTEKRGVHYAVIYEGRNNPVTGTEVRRWHRCDDRSDAERVAAELTAARQTRGGSSMTLSDYLFGRWLPARENSIAASVSATAMVSIAAG